MNGTGRRVPADGLGAQQRMNSQRTTPVGDTGGRLTSSTSPRSEADRTWLQQRRLFKGPGAPYGQSR